MKPRYLIVTCLFSTLVFCSGAGASERSSTQEGSACVWDTCVPKKKTVDGQELSLRGHAPFRYWGFKVYTAALYAPVEIHDIESTLGSVPMRLEIHYYRKFSAKDFRESGEGVLKQNPGVNIAVFRPQLNEINSLYRPVRVGDSYALTFAPGKGLTLLLNDTPLGTVRGDKFARAYLGIWLSRYSLSSRLTRALTQG